jgi:hypothetical protein
LQFADQKDDSHGNLVQYSFFLKKRQRNNILNFVERISRSVGRNGVQETSVANWKKKQMFLELVYKTQHKSVSYILGHAGMQLIE